jgi:hypothetical protein
MAGYRGSGGSKVAYWNNRRTRQWSRFGGRLGKVYNKPSTANVAKAAWSGVKYLRTLVNSETLRFDISASGTAVSDSGGVVHLSALVEGDTVSGRTGNSVLAKGLSFRARIVSNSSSSATLCRLMLVCDKQQISDTSPGVTDILDVASPLSHLSTNASGRFDVLFDQVYQFDNLSRRAFYINKYVNINKYHLRYNGTSGTDIQKNGMYLLYVSTENTNTPVLDYRNRFSYHDN